MPEYRVKIANRIYAKYENISQNYGAKYPYEVACRSEDRVRSYFPIRFDGPNVILGSTLYSLNWLSKYPRR